MAASWQAVSALLHPTLASQLPAPPSRLSTYTALSPPPLTLPPAQVMYAEPLSARPMRPAGELLPGEEAGASAGGVASAGSAGGYLPATGGAGSAEENVAAAAAAAAVAGMAHTFMASPPEATCSTSMQLHTPMTGASRWMDGVDAGWKGLADTQVVGSGGCNLSCAAARAYSKLLLRLSSVGVWLPRAQHALGDPAGHGWHLPPHPCALSTTSPASPDLTSLPFFLSSPPLQASQPRVCCRAATARCRASPAPCRAAAATHATRAAARTLPTPRPCALAWPPACWTALTWRRCRTA